MNEKLRKEILLKTNQIIYKINEEENRHIENIKLLVFEFGTREEEFFIEALIKYGEYKQATNIAREELYKIHIKYINKLFPNEVIYWKG